jgi:salicylate synthase
LVAQRRQYHSITVPVTGDPLLVVARLARHSEAETHFAYEKGGMWAFAIGRLAQITVDRTVVRMRGDGPERAVPWTERPLAAVAELLREVPVAEWRAYGIAGFELAYANAGLLDALSEDALLDLVVPETEVRIAKGSATIRSVRPERLTELAAVLAEPVTEPRYRRLPIAIEPAGAAEEYQAAVASAVRDIHDGKLQKVILSRKVPLDAGLGLDLVGSFVTGRRNNNPARSFLLHLDGLRAAGFSPETVVEVERDGRVLSQPLAGTRALGADAAQNEQLRNVLLTDSKEIYEHAISVKVACDELRDICQAGSVRVEEFMAIKERGTVQHLGSTVTGQLAAPYGPWDALATLFPAVTASGVPKRAAYECINAYEREPRGLYSGAVLTVDEAGELDAALVLRTLCQRDGISWLRAGAGIVGDSRPEREFQETCEKLLSVALNLVTRQEEPATLAVD